MASMFVPLCGAEHYFKDFPTTFCNYEEKLCIGDAQRREFYVIIAEKVADLYASSLRLQLPRYRVELFDKAVILNEEKIEIFRKALNDYILHQLSTGKMVDLVTNKTPESELKSVLNQCNIDLEAPAEHNIFFLPHKSRIFLSPYVQEEYGHQDGLDIFMERTITGIKLE
jgi:hypothetical protein